MTVADLKLFLDNMYDQLDPDQIDLWQVQDLEVNIDGRVFRLAVAPVDQ